MADTDHLDGLVERSIYIMREAKARFKNPAILFAGGKDSTVMLYIARQAFLGQIPIPVVFINTSWQFKETYNFIEMIKNMWNLDLVHAKNRLALMKGVSPKNHPKMECCTMLKTDALRDIIENQGYDALMVGIRWDEHEVRSKETNFSPKTDPDHVRVHPILHWSEKDVWDYIKKENIPINPLYSYNIEGKRYRSIGCYPCTKPVSDEEAERAGRAQDKEEVMERLRALGYM